MTIFITLLDCATTFKQPQRDSRSSGEREYSIATHYDCSSGGAAIDLTELSLILLLHTYIGYAKGVELNVPLNASIVASTYLPYWQRAELAKMCIASGLL